MPLDSVSTRARGIRGSYGEVHVGGQYVGQVTSWEVNINTHLIDTSDFSYGHSPTYEAGIPSAEVILRCVITGEISGVYNLISGGAYTGPARPSTTKVPVTPRPTRGIDAASLQAAIRNLQNQVEEGAK